MGESDMLFAWIGFLKDGAEMIPPVVQQQTNDFLAQPYIPIQSVGPLCDETGRRAGAMLIFEANNRAAAESFVAESPYLKAGLYERHQLYEYRNEAG
jgi:uncharacterized protein YciI